MTRYFVLITVVVFLLLTAVFYLLQLNMPEYRFTVLMTGNLVMALLTLLSYRIVRRQLNQRPEAFVRGVYGATLLKLMVCMFSILLYVLLNRANIHKPSLFILFGIYAVYTAIETWLLSKMAKEAK